MREGAPEEPPADSGGQEPLTLRPERSDEGETVTRGQSQPVQDPKDQRKQWEGVRP